MLDVDDFIGTWRTMDFPGCVSNDQGIITFHVSSTGIATLWKLQGRNTETFTSGQLAINNIGDGSFDIRIDGDAIDDVFLTIPGSMYIPNPSPSFISEIPNHGRRYFERI